MSVVPYIIGLTDTKLRGFIMKCYVDDCERDSVSKGLCDKHYRRMLKRGSPYDIGSKKVDEGDEIERFHKKYVKDKNTGCWNWIAGTRPNARGKLYGRHHMDNGKGIGAHRFSFMIHNGEIPNGKYVCHRCDNPLCVNPEHLFIGTHVDNMRDMVEKGRSYKGSGEKKGVSKLTNYQAAEIMQATGTNRDIAKQYGVSVSVVGRIKRGETYKDAKVISTRRG